MFSVVMAVLNGMPYVVEQVKSFAAQTMPPKELIVGDNGSTDSTLAALEEMRPSLPFDLRIIRNPTNLGIANNFLNACEYAREDYVCFSDHDDVWLPNKLEVLKGLIQAHPTVTLFAHKCEVVNEKLETVGTQYPLIREDRLEQPLTANLVKHGVPGMSMCFKRSDVAHHDWKSRPQDFTFSNEKAHHDNWTLEVANGEGGVYFISSVLALYRRHSKNASHFSKGSNLSRRLNQMLRTISQTRGSDELTRQETHFREWRDYLDKLKSEPTISPANAERYGKLAEQYRQVHKFAAYRLQFYKTTFPTRLFTFSQAVFGGGYFDKQTFTRAVLAQDAFFALSVKAPVK